MTLTTNTNAFINDYWRRSGSVANGYVCTGCGAWCTGASHSCPPKHRTIEDRLTLIEAEQKRQGAILDRLALRYLTSGD